MNKFGTGRNSIQAQLNPNNSMSLKKDRDYIRRIIQESKEQRSSSVNGDIQDVKSDNKLKWDQQENRFTRKPPEMREGPSKDHKATLNYLEEQRSKSHRLQDVYQRRIGSSDQAYGEGPYAPYSPLDASEKY